MKHTEGFLKLVDDARTRVREVSVEQTLDRMRRGARLIDVGEAQRLLDSRRAEITARIGALKRGALARDAAARGRWLEAEVDGTQRVSRLKVKYLDASMRDPELRAGLDRLVADYDAMFADR